MPDDGNFHTAPITGKHDQGGQTFVQEVSELNRLSGFVQDVMMRQLNQLQFRAKPVVLSFRNRVQNFIPTGPSTGIHPITGEAESQR
jgi:hypothetical protein